jgi:hypothetical protein
MSSPRIPRQTGQALPLALVLLVAVAAVVFFMFNSGQLVQEKIRLTNTADAVAYSAGVFEARVLNYDAYTNRAIIANEIAIGQAVALASWLKYIGTTADNISPYLYLIPYAGPALSAAMQHVENMASFWTEYALAPAVSLHDAAIHALAASQFAMHGPGNTVALASRKALMDMVVQKNDPDASVDLLPVADDFAGFTQEYSSKEDRKRMGQIVHDDRDAFLKSRNWNFGLVVLCTGVQLRKRGSTELIDMVDGWKSMDTLSAHHYRIRRFRCRRSEHPLGYGTAFSDDGLDDSAYSYAGSRSTNPIASSLAESSVADGFEPPTLTGGAIPAFHELSEDVLKQDDPHTTLAIRVSKARAKQVFSGGGGSIKPQGSLDLYGGALAKDESAAVSKVEVFFERPDGKNTLFGKEELGSLFNPYWQARLAPVSTGERALAQLRQGLQLP